MASTINKVNANLHGHADKKGVAQNETHEQSVQPARSAEADLSPDVEQNYEPKQESNDQIAGNRDESKGVEVHNYARSAKNLSHMSWDSSLAREATTYAEELAKKGQMQHSGTSGQGENLFMSTGDASFSDAVQSWLDEEKDYKGEKVGEGNFAKWGHFCES